MTLKTAFIFARKQDEDFILRRVLQTKDGPQKSVEPVQGTNNTNLSSSPSESPSPSPSPSSIGQKDTAVSPTTNQTLITPTKPKTKKSTPPPSFSPPPVFSPNSHPPTRERKRSNHLAIVAGAIGGATLLLVAIVGYLCMKTNVAIVKPWATGLSGQLQKAFVTGNSFFSP